MKRLIATTALVFVPLAAALPAATPAPTMPLYEVEVLVFEQRLPELEGGELWIRDIGKPPETESAATVVPAPESLIDTPLATAAAALTRDGRYRILAHQRWQQGAEARSSSPPVRISGQDGELDGTLRFYLSRFLHVDVDLVYRERQRGLFGGSDIEQPFRITEHRRIKTADLNYFDHPKFGALVRVVQVGKE